MKDKTELQQSRDDLFSILDEKLKDMPEWRAFRAVDRACAAVGDPVSRRESPRRESPARQRRAATHRSADGGGRLSYGNLGIAGIKAAGRPMTTDEMVKFISDRRQVNKDPKRARVNVQSALSRDSRIESTAWREGRAWWLKDQPKPPMYEKKSAEQSLNL